MPLTRESLDRLVQHGCQSPGCDHASHGPLFLTPRCHPKAGVDVSYSWNSGVVRMACRHCGLLVFDFEVAWGSEDDRCPTTTGGHP